MPISDDEVLGRGVFKYDQQGFCHSTMSRSIAGIEKRDKDSLPVLVCLEEEQYRQGRGQSLCVY